MTEGKMCSPLTGRMVSFKCRNENCVPCEMYEFKGSIYLCRTLLLLNISRHCLISLHVERNRENRLLGVGYG